MARLRFVTAASLFDGHDVSINIIRRMLQAKGVEVIHLGHNRSAQDVVKAVLNEDAHAVALSSYQGGHVEYFSYVRKLLNEAGATEVRIFGGGGGVITPKEIALLESKGITKVYSPGDGMEMGLDGIIDDMVKRCEFDVLSNFDPEKLKNRVVSNVELSKAITYIVENGKDLSSMPQKATPVLGVTGTGGAGKSSLIDELLLRFNKYYPKKKLALISIDPTKKKNQGALLGDRIRLNSTRFENIYVRSLATRDSGTELGPHVEKVINYLKTQEFDLIMVETSGIGQASDAITSVADKSIYVMTPEYGAQTQLEKIEMIDAADFIVLNKFERPRAEDALRDIRKQYRRNKKIFDQSIQDQDLPVFGTIASSFNDWGVNDLFYAINQVFKFDLSGLKELKKEKASSKKNNIIPLNRMNYLLEIAEACQQYNRQTNDLKEWVREFDALNFLIEKYPSLNLQEQIEKVKKNIPVEELEKLKTLKETITQYQSGIYKYKVRDKEISTQTKFESLSGLSISKVALPQFSSDVDYFQFARNENLPGFFPFAAGIFPFKRTDEDPKRMFAGEGGPTRTNKRFHFLSDGENAKRLSTAFDSATLYGEDPDYRPDIFGKIGESGVSIATLDDMIDLFRGFNLASPSTSVSMTINGPAPIILAMFANAATKQVVGEKEFCTKDKIIEVMQNVRGTVQSDILKEDQAQNTCIFSLPFALRLMGDVQEFFSINKIKNYYTVSISGYHIAEAGANPITQLAFTLANGFTYVEYYLGRGIKIDQFCENLSFFFSNGLDPEYSVIGRVARKIWAIAMKYKYGASEKSQKFKYHIQTSGRSLHAQEIDFNDIRTTLQAYLAISDNCNSLHTNAYDEAITTPTEESVRRAMAIQLILNREFGQNKTDNNFQGSFLINELSELVEEAVLKEFERISAKGGVLGAMEGMYQRSKIQDESLYYESLKDNGKLPIIGVNTYIADDIKDKMQKEIELSRCSYEEKEEQISRLNNFKKRNSDKKIEQLEKLKSVVINEKNIFEELLTTVQYCSLGEIVTALYEVGGQYRRNV